MKLRLHHINLSTENVERMDKFYQDVLKLDRDTTDDLPILEKNKGSWYIKQYNLLLPIPNELLIDYSKEIINYLENEN